MNVLSGLKKSLREKSVVNLAVAQTEDEKVFGVVVRVATEFVALREIAEFEVAGILVVPLSVVADIVDDRNVRCSNRVLKGNGQLEKLRPPKWLDKCETMEEVFRQLMKRDIWPAVEVKEDEDEWFLIGPIEVVEPEGFVIRHYLADGTWDDRYPVGLPYVTQIGFDGSYEKHFGNYMKLRARGRATETETETDVS